MQQLTTYMDTLVSYVGPNLYLQALVIALLSIFFAKLAEFFLTRVIARVAARSSTNIDDEIIQLARRPVFMTVLVVGLIIASTRLPLESEAIRRGTISALGTIILFSWSSFAFRFSRAMINSLRSGGGRLFEARMLPLIQNVSQLLIFAVSVYVLFLLWNINVTAWVASAGIVGLALSFAAKDTLANLFAGASIIADAPYKVGDFVRLESGERGVVTHIGLRSTRLLTRDDVEITIPNAVIGSGKIVNEAGGPHEKHRIRVAVGVAYGSDIDEVMAILKGVADAHEELCTSPEPKVRFRAFGDSSLDFELLAWIEQSVDRGRLRHEMHCDIYRAFQAHAIEIPFPQRDLHVKHLPDRA